MTLKRLLPLLFLPLAALPAGAQEARTLFVNMPDSILSLLTPVNRADCIDFLDSHMKAVVTNRLNGQTEMTRLSPDYICLQLTAQSTWQMKVLPVSDSLRVICTVATACAPACNSRLRFYSTSWEPLPASRFMPALPGVEDFLLPRPDSVSYYKYREAIQQADMPLLQMSLSPDDTTLRITLDTPAMLEKEAADELKPFIRRELIYNWKEGVFSDKRLVMSD